MNRKRSSKKYRRGTTLAVLVGGSAAVMNVSGVAMAADTGTVEPVTIDVEGQATDVQVPTSNADGMDRAKDQAAPVQGRGGGSTAKSDSHDNSCKDKGDSKGQSPKNTGKDTQGGGGGGDATAKTDSQDNSAKDDADSIGNSANHTGTNSGGATATATGKLDSNDNSANDVGDSVGNSASDTGKDTGADSDPSATAAAPSNNAAA